MINIVQAVRMRPLVEVAEGARATIADARAHGLSTHLAHAILREANDTIVSLVIFEKPIGSA